MGSDQFCSAAGLRAVIITAVSWAAVANSAMAVDQLQALAERVGVRVLAEGTSDKEVMALTKTRIPFDRMSESARKRAAAILADLSQYRRMPTLQYSVDPNIYQYLINNPDVAVSTWRVMGISKLQMWQTDEFEYEAAAADGSEGIADVLWRDANQCLFIVEGKYTSPLLPTAINASALVWLQYRFVDAKDGTYLVNQQVETFVYFPSMAVDTIARIASRVTNTILDRNAFEVSLYARMMSQAAAKDPAWIEQLAQRMEGVLPQRKTELMLVARGQNPASGRSQADSDGLQERVAKLQKSGEFRDFENSLRQLNRHSPLPIDTTAEVRGQSAARPQESIAVSAANSTTETISRRVLRSAPLVFLSATPDPRQHAKASSTTAAVGPSHPVRSSSVPARPSLTVRTVTQEQTSTTDAPDQKPAETLPPIHPKPVPPTRL